MITMAIVRWELELVEARGVADQVIILGKIVEALHCPLSIIIIINSSSHIIIKSPLLQSKVALATVQWCPVEVQILAACISAIATILS